MFNNSISFLYLYIFPHLPLVTPREKLVAFVEMKATVIEAFSGLAAADYATNEDLTALWSWDIGESIEIWRILNATILDGSEGLTPLLCPFRLRNEAEAQYGSLFRRHRPQR